MLRPYGRGASEYMRNSYINSLHAITSSRGWWQPPSFGRQTRLGVKTSEKNEDF